MKIGDARPLPVPCAAGIRVTVGVGKTSRTVRRAGALIRKVKQAGGRARIMHLVPSHRLSNELATAYGSESDITTAVWRGREQHDPDTKEPMCRDLPRVRDALATGASVQQAACSARPTNDLGERHLVRCPHYAQCRYQKQKVACAKADVFIAPHQCLWHPPPEEVCDGITHLIIDESFWQSGIAPPATLTDAALDPSRLGVVFDRGVIDNVSVSQLREYRLKLVALLCEHPDGPIARQAALAAGITPQICSIARKLEWDRKEDPGIRPNTPVPERRRLAQAAGDRSPAAIRRFAAVWEALEALVSDNGPDRSGRLSRTTNSTTAGAVAALRVRSKREVAKAFRHLPTLILDATLNVEIVRHWFPNVEVEYQGNAATPHQNVRQVADRTFGKSWFLTHHGLKPEENLRRERNVTRVADYIALRAQQFGSLLVVTYKDLEELLIRRELPDNVTTAHFNNLRGLDGHREVDCIIVVGRPLPPSGEVEAMAGALTGAAVEAVERYNPGGRHPDDMTECLRWQICEAELLQVIGRGRGVNRTADNPLQVDLLTNVQLPLEVHERFRWKQLEVNKVDRMALAGAVLLSPGDAAKAYPDIFKNVAAARSALRVISSENPYEYIFIGKLTLNRPVEVVYRPEPGGRGQQSRKAIFDPDRVPDPKGWLVEHLGNVAISETVVFRGVV